MRKQIPIFFLLFVLAACPGHPGSNTDPTPPGANTNNSNNNNSGADTNNPSMNAEFRDFVSSLFQQALYVTNSLALPPVGSAALKEFTVTVDQSTGNLELDSSLDLSRVPYGRHFSFQKILSSTKAIYKTKLRGQSGDRYIILDYKGVSDSDPEGAPVVEFSQPEDDPALLNTSTETHAAYGAFWTTKKQN